MKILLLSDIHNEFGKLTDESYKTDADVVVLAGDIDTGTSGAGWASKVFDKPVVYVAGNHEYYHRMSIPAVNNAILSKCSKEKTNVYFLQNKTCEFDDVRFIGATLWSDFNLFGTPSDSKRMAHARMNDYRYIFAARGEIFTPDASIHEFQKSVEFIQNELSKPFSGKTVVVTHHAPSFKSIVPKYQNDALSPAYGSNLEYLMNEFKPALWCHGHTHSSVDYIHNETRVVANPRGYYRTDENPEFNPHLIIEV